MITSLHSGQETIVIVGLHHIPFSLHIFQSKTWNRALIMKSACWDPPVLSVLALGLVASVSERKQMQQNYSEPDPLKIFDMCIQVCEEEVEQRCKARCQLPGVWKSSTMMHCCTPGLLSEDGGSADLSFVLLRHAVERLWSTRMAATCKLSRSAVKYFMVTS